MNPEAEAARLNIDLYEGVPQGEISGAPSQPLTFNAMLLAAARDHSKDMITNDFFSHSSLDGTTPFDRMTTAGYGYWTAGENIAFSGSTRPMNGATVSAALHDNLFVDENYPGRGHRVNILLPDFKEVGVGLASGSYTTNGELLDYSFMVTCDFGASREQSDPFLLGVVYDDKDKDVFYDAGEGIGEVAITLTGYGSDTVTASTGGYAIPVPSGSYAVEARLPNGQTLEQQVVVNDQNVKVDFLLENFASGPDDHCALISDGLDTSIPCAGLNLDNSSLPLTVEMGYQNNVINGSPVWQLNHAAVIEITDGRNCASINRDYTITIPCAQYRSERYKLVFSYQGVDNLENLIWTLTDITAIDTD